MKKFTILLTMVFCFMFVGLANALVMDFDEVSGSGFNHTINGLYQGFTFTNAGIIETDEVGNHPAAYENADVSPDNVLYTSGGLELGMSSSTLFTFNDAYFTSLYNDGQNVVVAGFLNGVETESNTFITNPYTPTLVTFDWVGIDAITINCWGGSTTGFYASNSTAAGKYMAMDNLRYGEPTNGTAPVPEPATILLMGVGLIGIVGFKGFQKNKHQKV